jgi:hypothetical protein
VLAVGALLCAIAFVAFAIGSLPLLALGFILGGVAIGCAETAQHAAVAALAPTAGPRLGFWPARSRAELWKSCRELLGVPRSEPRARSITDLEQALRCRAPIK